MPDMTTTSIIGYIRPVYWLTPKAYRALGLPPPPPKPVTLREFWAANP